MSNISQSLSAWSEIETPPDAKPPSPLTVRAQALPSRSYFPHHTHSWGQVVYAIAGVLTVATDGRSFVISPGEAVWLPPETGHQVGSLHGADFRSLWVGTDAAAGLSAHPKLFEVSPLLRALIMEAAHLQDEQVRDDYSRRVEQMIIAQLERSKPILAALPWPTSEPLTRLCEALYANPGDERSADEWSRTLGMSPRTLTRRFEAEAGMSLRSWRRRVRLFKAVELLGGGMDVTRTALELGYGSPSAFAHAFKTAMGQTPRALLRRAASGQ